jgi:hypothetical protein
MTLFRMVYLFVLLNVLIQCVSCYAQCHYAECHCAKCRSAECCGAFINVWHSSLLTMTSEQLLKISNFLRPCVDVVKPFFFVADGN